MTNFPEINKIKKAIEEIFPNANSVNINYNKDGTIEYTVKYEKEKKEEKGGIGFGN